MKTAKRARSMPPVEPAHGLLSEQLTTLRELLPQAFSEGKIDFDKLRVLLGQVVDSRPERYSFSWAGKLQAIRLAQTPSRVTLLPVPTESMDFDTTHNLL